MTRTILVHLNVELPGDDGITVDDVSAEVQAALEVAIEGEHSPALNVAALEISACEEV